MVERRLSSDAIDSAQTQHSSAVAEAFDSVAAVFDTDLENATTARIRERLYSVIQLLIRPGSTVLDINCGTGIDAVYLARRGYRVYGIDISERMITTARSKLAPSESESVKFLVTSYDKLTPEIVPHADLVFSNFGGLNCTSDLASAANAIASVTKPGGYFIGVIMPPFSLWESASFAFRLQWRQVFRRVQDHAPATGFRGNVFPVYYYSPRATAAAFSSHFVQKQIVGLSIISPTPQSTRFVHRHPVLAHTLVAIDKLIEGFPIIRSTGDHYVIVLQRRK